MAIVSVNKTVYQPVFDPTTSKYVDSSPFECHSRNNVVYTCLCNHKTFNTLTTFKSHIKLKSHIRFLENYVLHIEESVDAKLNCNDYQTKYELLERKYKILEQQHQDIISELLHHKFMNMILKYKALNLSKTDSFEDCLDEDSLDDLFEESP